MRSSRGQASVEYVAILVLVGAVLLAALAITTGGLGPRVADAVERGLCALTGSACPAPPRTVADLPPCPLTRRSRTQELKFDVTFIHEGQDLTLMREAYSDGHVDITFADGQALGLRGTLGAGFHIGVPKEGVKGASVHADAVFTSGRRWSFTNAAAADEFVRRHGSFQTLAGRVEDGLKRDCFLCHWIGFAKPDDPPPPDAEYRQVGGRLGASVSLASDGIGLSANLELTGALGVRHTRSGERTFYFQAGATAGASLLLRAGAGRTGGATLTVGVTVDRAGHPTALNFAGAGVDSAEATRRVVGTYRQAAGEGTVHELEFRVPLDAPGATRVGDAVLRGLSVAHVGELPGAIAAAARWGRRNATITERTYALSDHRGGLEVSGTLGAKLGAGVGTNSRGLRLLDVRTRLPGLPFLTRADCLAT